MPGNFERILKNIPQEGFLKLTKDDPIAITSEQKAALIRKGNDFFNSGEFEKAKRVFITTGYSDGLIRIGDWYYEKKDHLEALRMYWLAPAPDKIEKCTIEVANALKKWIKDDY